MALPFLKDFAKMVSKMETAAIGLMQTQSWLSTGNYALNRALSGNFRHGVPFGRISGFMGPSGSGKSFIASNIMVEAQQQGCVILVLDSENALDIDYLRKIGVNVNTEDFIYTQVITIEDVNKILSDFFSSYVKAYGRDNPDAPKVLIVLDSLGMLSSTTEMDNYEKAGVVKGDQGQLAKRRKAMLRMITGAIARLPIAFVMTDHVYPADIMLGDGAWAITNSVKFCASIIGIVTKLKLKEEGLVTGVRMRFETYKSRFAKLGTKVELEVPYNKGMSPFSGLIDLLETMKVVRPSTTPGKKQGWMVSDIDGEEFFFRPDSLTHSTVDKLLAHPACTPIGESEEEEPLVESTDDEAEQEDLDHGTA